MRACPSCRREAAEVLVTAAVDEMRARESQYRPLLPAGAKVLEIGSCVGGFLHVAREWGWEPLGLDVGEDTSQYPTRMEALEACRFTGASFDGVFI